MLPLRSDLDLNDDDDDDGGGSVEDDVSGEEGIDFGSQNECSPRGSSLRPEHECPTDAQIGQKLVERLTFLSLFIFTCPWKSGARANGSCELQGPTRLDLGSTQSAVVLSTVDMALLPQLLVRGRHPESLSQTELQMCLHLTSTLRGLVNTVNVVLRFEFNLPSELQLPSTNFILGWDKSLQLREQHAALSL
ncbi:hypothetical protein P7K49_013741 [Saguinus oedipus]|uniref:Uncharacterized protein n=1 Tax=Saguinus oedipus TaxID=9490 RepID=A0ABQ9VHC6_SAGOE|nr:hypothetical protein P7K49_013741 [Saguinus oedipus]